MKYPYLEFFSKYDGFQRPAPNEKWYRTYCPFPDHKDNNPSTDIDLTKSGFRCWSCGRTGNHIDFVMMKDRVSESAARLLLSQYQLKTGQSGFLGKESKRVFKPKANYLNPDETLDLFLPISNNSIYSDYIESRKLSTKLLAKYGFRQGSIIKKGWNDRLIYPIYDSEGNLCSIEGRDITGKSPLRYNKWKGSLSGQGLFGIDHLQDYKRHYPLIIVEGAFDALSIVSTDHFAVAMVCSDLTSEQLRQLKSITDYPIMIFDGIKKGTENVRKVVYNKYKNILSQNFKQYKIVEIPFEDCDPNDMLRKRTLKSFLKKVTN